MTCAGILPSQYTHMCKFVDLGVVGHGYIRQGWKINVSSQTAKLFIYIDFSVYHKRGYIAMVEKAAEESMQTAVDEVKEANSDYLVKGEVNFINLSVTLMLRPTLQWVISDARHDSTANAYHTTVPCLSGR